MRRQYEGKRSTPPHMNSILMAAARSHWASIAADKMALMSLRNRPVESSFVPCPGQKFATHTYACCAEVTAKRHSQSSAA
eukprot:SAG31_NODE_571_length_13998_cov_4.346212_3_plen_80_part_00